MTDCNINLHGSYDVTITDEFGQVSTHHQSNTVLRSGLRALLEGTCIRNLFIGRGVTLPSVDETYTMSSIMDVESTDYTVTLAEDGNGIPYYEHKWKFHIPPGEILTAVTEMGTGYVVDVAGVKDRRFFSRTILRDDNDVVNTINKRAVDTLDITYTLHLRFTDIMSSATEFTLGGDVHTAAIGQHSLTDNSILALNQGLPGSKFFQGYAFTQDSEFKPFVFTDEELLPITADKVVANTLGAEQSIALKLRFDSVDDSTLGRIAIYSRLGVIQYRLTPLVVFNPGGYLELTINFVLGNK